MYSLHAVEIHRSVYAIITVMKKKLKVREENGFPRAAA
jgi:hypothetical protein